MVGALVSFRVGRTELKREAFHKLEAVRAIKRDQIERFFHERLADVRTLSVNPALRAAFSELRAAALAAGRGRQLRGLDRRRFESPPSYRRVHDRHFEFLSGFIRELGFYDLLLLDEQGLTVFSVEKEGDFGGAHADEASALGDAWRAVRATGGPTVTDMKLYAPSRNIPAQFVAAPVVGTDGAEGVLVLQVSIDSIDRVMSRRDGMGRTEESYLVGADHRLRSDSALDPRRYNVVSSFQGAPERHGVETMAVKLALDGREGARIQPGYRGTTVLSAYAPVAVGRTTWALVVEIEEEEIDRRIDHALSGVFLLILIVSAAAVLLLASLFSVLITRHLRTLSSHFSELTEDVLAGRLMTSGEVERVGSDFRPVVTRTNDLIAAFVSRLDDLPVPVLMMDRDHRLCFVNSETARLSGHDRSEMIGRPCREVLGCRGCPSGAECPAERSMASSLPVRGETLLAGPNGDIPVEYTTSPVRHPDGTLLGAWQVLMDRTEHRQMAEQNRRLESQLFRAQRLDALGTLSSGIAHDFNNILSYMLVYAEIIGQELPQEGQARRGLDQITSAIERAAEIVRQMLVFSRKMEGQRLVFDAVPVVRDTVALCSASLPGDTMIELDCGAGPLTLEGDPTHIGQVVMNLCANARDALRPRGGTIRAGLSRQEELTGPRVGEPPLGRSWIRLRVEDTGSGMDEKTKERLFEPFFTTKPPGHGTGLGLAVVHGIVTTWGGWIEVRSSPGEGTTMDVYLPAVDPGAAPPPA